MSRKEQEIMRDIKRRWAIKYSNGELFCFLCGKKILKGEKYNADHWIPRALGGETTEENIKPAHESCNLKKGCLSPEEFLEHKDEILSKKYHKNNKKEQKKHNLQYSYNIGSNIYYVKEHLSEEKPFFEVKDGIIIGFSYKNTIEYALVKDFYIDKDGKVQSELVETIPLTKIQAIATKIKYEKIIKELFQNQIQAEY